MRALWNLGFRPFYLGAAIYAALSLVPWSLEYAGVIPGVYGRSPLRHGQEMVFGFAFAVVAGFLFTAVRNWTNRPTPTGGALAGIFLLWLAARVLAFTPFVVAAAVVNASFLVAVAAGIAIPLATSSNRRNYFFVALLAFAAVAALMSGLALGGAIAWPERATLQVALDVVLFIVAVVAGRVMPMFTNNAIPGAEASRRPWIERASLGSILALLAADVLQLPGAVLAIVAIVAALANAARLALWHPWRTRGTPLVWVLHAAYAWIPIHLLLRAAASLDWIASPLATHALTIGVIGGMTIGMMTRTARGHSGRPLRADGAEVAAYLLVQAAAIVRVFGGMLVPQLYVGTVVASAACWSTAYAIYAVRYWPILTQPRVDGKPG